MEARPEDQEKKNQSNIFTVRKLAIGAFITTLLGAGIWQYKEIMSGEKLVYDPLEYVETAPDSQFSAITWNMHHETYEHRVSLKKLISERQPDAVCLQEVEADSIEALRHSLPNWQISYVRGDIKDDVLSGGMGNAILTRQKQQNTTSSKIEGTPLITSVWGAIKGGAAGVARANSISEGVSEGIDNAKDGFQANRAIIASTIQFRTGQRNRDIRIVASHISAQGAVREKQRADLSRFTLDQIKDGRPTILCADANAGPTTMIPFFSKIGMIAGFNRTPTTDDKKVPIDWFGYSGVEIVGLDHTRVIPGFKTDHRPLEIMFDTDPFPQQRPAT